MITPRFSLSQTPETLIIIIVAPHCNLSTLEAEVYDEQFLFVSLPYFLRINLPGSIVEDVPCTDSSFDADTGEFRFVYPKKHPGEHFENLDAISRFFIRREDVPATHDQLMLTGQQFGFAMKGNEHFKRVYSEFTDIFEIDPTEVALKDRRGLTMEIEQKKFSSQHYLYDWTDEERAVQEIMEQTAPWTSINAEELEYGPEVFDFINKHRKKKYCLSPEELTYCHNGLLDILFAYCYDRRTTYFEGTCESYWTISKVSATLSCFDGFATLGETIRSAFRRCLIYPLYRNFKLALTVLEDLRSLLRLKEKYIVKCLMEIYDIFLHGGCYILNSLFITDYIFYVMEWDSDQWNKTVSELGELMINKESLGLNLTFIENCAIGELAADMVDVVAVDSDDSESEEERDT